MIILGLALLFIGFFTAVLSLSGEWDNGGILLVFLIGVALAAGGFIFLVKQFNKEGRIGHAALYRQLVAEGWNVQSNDVSWQEDTAQVGCLKFDVNKVAGTYQVTVPRSAKVGGGNIVIYPKETEAIVKRLCG